MHLKKYACLQTIQFASIELWFFFNYDIVGFFLYSIIKIDLNVPYYFASIQKMINDYPINKL
jgi:hypothetical protein